MDINLLIQAGCAGIAIYCIYSLRKIVSNHINHNTEALTKLNSSIERQEQTTNGLQKAINELLIYLKLSNGDKGKSK